MATESTFAVMTDDKKSADELKEQGIINGYAYLGGWSVTETKYLIVLKEDVSEEIADQFIAANRANGHKLRKTIWR